jgi:hypothetical protein
MNIRRLLIEWDHPTQFCSEVIVPILRTATAHGVVTAVKHAAASCRKLLNMAALGGLGKTKLHDLYALRE